MNAHSKVGASSSYRWLECPGSVVLCERAPPQVSSIYADEGTAAHSLAEKCLNSGKDAHSFLGLIIPTPSQDFKVDTEMANHVQTYLDIVRKDRKKYSDFNGCETRIHLDWIHEDMFGTADSHCGTRKKKLIVHDLKYGAGIPVEAVNNTQGLYYVAGVAAQYDFDFDECEFVIVQPRAFHPEGPVRRWSFPVSRLRQYEHELIQGMDRIEKAWKSKDIMDFLKPGDHCKWCAAAIDCPSLRRKMELTVFEDFDVVEDDLLSVTPTPPEELSMDKLVMALEFGHIFESWIKQVRSYAYRLAEEGNPPPGYKLVQKYGHRKIINPEKMAEVLDMFGFSEADIYEPPEPPKMKSPAQLEKLFKKRAGWDSKFMRHFAKAHETGVALVPERDRRGALSNSVEDDFTAITD